MKKLIGAGALAVLLCIGSPVLLTAVVVAGGGIDLGSAVAADPVGSGAAGPAPPAGGIPPAMLALYQEAARTACAGLAWQVLAAIGFVESDHGRSDLPGVSEGSNYAGAEGPMQFEPATFAVYALPVPPGGADPPSPYDPVDAVNAAARMLCADGVGGDVAGAVFAYNHSQAYVREVLSVAASYASTG